MRDRVDLLRPVVERDAGGAMKTTYPSSVTRWGHVEHVSAREQLLAGAERARISATISLRYFEGLDETYRLKVGSRTFGIVGVTNPDGRKIEHVCDVVELPAAES